MNISERKIYTAFGRDHGNIVPNNDDDDDDDDYYEQRRWM